MVYKVVISTRAQRHLSVIEGWLLAHATEGIKAKEWLQKLTEAIESLKALPLRCPVVQKPRFPEGTRALYFGSDHVYTLFYRVSEEIVEVLALTGPGQQSFAKSQKTA